MLESKISKEDLIRANVDKDRVICAIRRYVCSIPEYLDRQVKVFSTNGLGKWEMVVSQRDVEEFITSLLPMEFIGLIAPEDIVDVREAMKLEGSHPVWGWKRSGFAMDCRSEISLYYMEIYAKIFFRICGNKFSYIRKFSSVYTQFFTPAFPGKTTWRLKQN